MKKLLIFTLLTAITSLLTIYILSSCSSESQEISDDKNDSDDYDLACIYPDKYLSDKYIEDELPPEEFIGTIIEEEIEYIVVEPNIDEDEYDIAKKIHIDFIRTEGKDYIYGTGRTVHITYIPKINVIDGIGYIETDAIATEGFEDFEISVIPDSTDIATYVIDNNSINEFDASYGLYYSGLMDVYVTVDGKTMPLSTALRMGKVTLSGILSKCNTLAATGDIEKQQYKDGGSVKFILDDFSIIKCNTIDGNHDMFIGKKDMDLNVINSTSHVYVRAYLDYGIIISATDVSSTGATLIFEKYEGFNTGTLQFGESYQLEVLTDRGWQKVEYSTDVETEMIIWYDIAYLINESEPYTQQKIDWCYLYGKLPAGKYRLKKDIMDFRKSADYDNFSAYCYFEINNKF